MLVGIYGSKELFVNEYRIMLADKLLANLEYDTDKEVHTVELLKLRFGEESMRQCEVMIKDIDDSKRVYANVYCPLDMKYSTEDDLPCLDAVIVSHIFWPPLQRDDMKHHYRIDSQMENYAEEYAILKNPRRLVWMKQLGHVELEVDETDADGNAVSHVKEVKCTPVHATLLAHFEDKPSWTVEELSTETEMSDEILRKRMAFWVNQRVVQQTRSGYSLISVHDARDADHTFVDHEDEDHQDQAVSFGAHEEEEMKVYESYIVGMLSNLGRIPLEKIHTMLKTFVTGSDHKYDKTPQQLAVFLQQLCKEEKLECSPDGLYNLLKKRS
jgi:anaphase-promoting complex subunit 2